MSTIKKAVAKVSVDDESGVILARAALPAELEARRKALLDPAAIDGAREGLDNFEDRLSHLSSMSNLFDDGDGDGDDIISMGGAVRADVAPVKAAGVVMAAVTDDADEDYQDEDGLVIGGLSLEDETPNANFTSPDNDDGLLSAFDDSNSQNFDDDVFDLPTTDQPAAAAPQMDENFFDEAPTTEGGVLDFIPADEAEIARNAQASQIAIEAGNALHDNAHEQHFGLDDDEPADGQLAGGDDVAGTVRFEAPVVGDDVSQNLGSIVGHRRDRQDLNEFAPLEDTSALFADDIQPVQPEAGSTVDDIDDLWATADPDDGIVGSWGEPEHDTANPVHFNDDYAGQSDVNSETLDDNWGFEPEGNPATGSDTYETGSAMADPSPWAAFEAETDIPGGSEMQTEPDRRYEAATDYVGGGEPEAPFENVNFNVSDDIGQHADYPHEGAESVRATKKQEHTAPKRTKAKAEPEAQDESWFAAGDDQEETADQMHAEAEEDGLDDIEPAKGGKNIAFMATSAAIVALIAGAGYFGAASLGLIGGAQPQPAAYVPVAQPAPIATPVAQPAPLAAPVEVASQPGATMAEQVQVAEGLLTQVGDLFNQNVPADVAPPIPDDAVQAPDNGSLADLVMQPIPEPARIEAPVDVVDAAADGLDDIARGLIGAADGNLDSLFLTDSAPPEEAVVTPAFDAEMVTDILVDYVKKDEAEELRSAIDLMFEKVTQISEEVTERDERILELEERIVSMSEKANRAETLALAQNEVLVEFVRVKEKVDMAESLIVDLSRRISSMETTDPADRVAVERSLEDIMSRLDSMARDIGLVARVAINGTPEKVRAGAASDAGGVPGSSAVYESTKSGLPAPGDAGKVPANVQVGDFVEGYGYVLQIMPTSDGARVVVMENKSVLLPN